MKDFKSSIMRKKSLSPESENIYSPFMLVTGSIKTECCFTGSLLYLTLVCFCFNAWNHDPQFGMEQTEELQKKKKKPLFLSPEQRFWYLICLFAEKRKKKTICWLIALCRVVTKITRMGNVCRETFNLNVDAEFIWKSGKYYDSATKTFYGFFCWKMKTLIYFGAISSTSFALCSKHRVGLKWFFHLSNLFPSRGQNVSVSFSSLVEPGCFQKLN